MSSSPEARLKNLAKAGSLHEEPGDQDEFEGMIGMAEPRLLDAVNANNRIESRFDLAYNACHSLALAALRWHGYRSPNRYIVFQALGSTLGLGAEKIQVLTAAHDKRNKAEYSGRLDVSEAIVKSLVAIGNELLASVKNLGPVPAP